MRRRKRPLGRFVRKLSLRDWIVYFAFAKTVLDLVLALVRNG
jgi:hypothetical protein